MRPQTLNLVMNQDRITKVTGSWCQADKQVKLRITGHTEEVIGSYWLCSKAIEEITPHSRSPS